MIYKMNKPSKNMLKSNAEIYQLMRESAEREYNDEQERIKKEENIHEMQMKDTLTKIREVLSGYNDSDLIEDNFLAALNVVANRNFGTEISTNDVTNLNNENERD